MLLYMSLYMHSYLMYLRVNYNILQMLIVIFNSLLFSSVLSDEQLLKQENREKLLNVFFVMLWYF